MGKKIDLEGYEDLLLERDGPILNVIMNRPDKLNPASGSISLSLIKLCRDLCHDDETRVVVLTGAGRAFSAGGDIAVMNENLVDPSRFIDEIHEVKDTVHSLIDCAKPIIAKINGHAIGLGATIALYCDIAFAAEEAKIADPHISMGLVPGDGGATIWTLLIGLSRAKQYLFTGDRLTGAEAARIGLVSAAYPAAELDAKVKEFALRLAEQSPRVLHLTKMAMNVPLKRELSALLDTAYAYETVAAYSVDHHEAVKAFLEKRKPTYVGR